MIPLRDNIPSGRFPWVNWMLIAANVLIFIFEISLGQEALQPFVNEYGLTPARMAADLSGNWLTFFTSIFLHGGWLHLIFNMLALFIFGDNVEDRFGHLLYLLFYLFGGIAASAVLILANSSSSLPTIGASGAIAAILGAYLVLYPRARILTIIPIFFFIQIVQIPAPLYLIFWFFSQLLSGTAEIASTTFQEGGVAWWAHIGGFLTGVLVAFLFFRREKPSTPSIWEQPEVITRNDPYGRP